MEYWQLWSEDGPLNRVMSVFAALTLIAVARGSVVAAIGPLNKCSKRSV